MRKTIKIITVISVISILFSLLLAIPSNAASSSLRVSSRNITPGSKLTVTVSISAGEAMYATEAYVYYNASVLQFLSGSSANGKNGSVRIVGTPGEAKSQSYTLSFKAIAEGSSSISLNGVNYVGKNDGNNTVSVGGSSTTVTVAKPAPSSNANLSSLTVSGASLSPSFSSGVTTYSASVPNTVSSVSVRAVAAASGANIMGIGDKALNEGENSFTITVTAPSGAKKSYTLNIRRRLKGELTTEERLTVSVGGGIKKVVKDASKLPTFENFKSKTENYNGVDVSVLTDTNEKYQIYYLSDSNGANPAPYIKGEKEDFVALPFILNSGKLYIVEDAENKMLPDGYTDKTFSKNDGNFKAYGFKNADTKNVYILNLYNGEKNAYYGYDSSNNALILFPIFEVESGIVKTYKKTENPQGIQKIIKNFKALSPMQKILFPSVAVGFIVILILAIVLIKKSKRRDYGDYSPKHNPIDADEFWSNSDR
ncbi:MAG: cadherin-like beta sandwich domain-containing protein [Clostridia bacterium]|nr:cadherin-like beta sandwich domain-containing protein [Clostridia bacterium]